MQCPVYFAKKLATSYDGKTCHGLDLSLFDEVTFRFHVKHKHQPAHHIRAGRQQNKQKAAPIHSTTPLKVPRTSFSIHD
jgi:hypothetical protein